MIKKRMIMMGCTIITIIATSFSVFASDLVRKDSKSELIDFVIEINQAMGSNMTAVEIDQFEKSLEANISMKALQKGVSKNDLYKEYLDELKKEVDVKDLSSYSIKGGDDDIGDTKLPESTTGNIFYVDNNRPWNHVGIYVAPKYIVEAMPKDGVQYWPISDIEAYQEPVDGSNDSCILSVSTTSTNKSNAALWAKTIGEKRNIPYDDDFIDNKSDYYYVNHGTPTFPRIVRYYESDAYNCSELVWKAYKKNGNVDLDSNGGLAVYPNNIYNSNKTTIVSYWGN